MDFYVDRDVGNDVVALYRNEQYPSQEKLTDTHADVVAFLDGINLETLKEDKLGKIERRLIDLFNFIDELFVVGKQKGLWVNSDFTPEILQRGQAWRQEIDEYEAL